MKPTIPVDMNIKPALATMAVLKSRMADLGKLLAELRIDADDKAAEAKIAKLQAQLVALAAKSAKINFQVDTKGVVAAEAQLLGLEAAAVGLKRAVDDTGPPMRAFTGNIGRWGAGLLTARIALFGGIASVGALHLALDALVEIAAVVIPALAVMTAGLAAFGIAGADAAISVYNRMLNVHTIFDATGSSIPPLTGKIEQLHAVVRPDVWQLYGDAIDIARNKTGLFAQLARETGAFLDRFGARVTVDLLSSGKGLATFVAAGKHDLAQLGQVFSALGNAFANLIKVSLQTHIAQYLLDIAVAGAKLLDVITKLPTPLLAVIVGLHGLYLWGGLAVTALVSMGRSVLGLGTGLLTLAEKAGIIAATSRTLTDAEILAGAGAAGAAEKTGLWATATGLLSKVPIWGWVALGVIAVGGLVFMLARAKDSTDRWVASVDKFVSASTIFNVVGRTVDALGQTTQRLTMANAGLAKQMSATTTGAAAFDKGVRAGVGTAQTAARDIGILGSEHARLSTQLTSEVTHVGAISHAYGVTLVGAIALASVAGVRVSDLMSGNAKVWAVALQQVRGLVQGYHDMGQGSGQLASDLNVLTYAQSSQLAAVGKLNTAYDTFTGNLSAPISSFITFANANIRFGKDATATGATMTGLGGAAVTMSRKVTDASLQLQQDFQDSFTAAEKLFDAMRLSGAPAGQQIKAIKDTVASLIPLAGSNRAAAAEISALAQEAGGPATTNLQTLGKWAGVTAKQGMAGLQTDTGNAAIAMSNLSLDAQKLSATLQQDLSSAMATAAFNARGGQKAFNDFAAGIVNNTTGSQKFAQSALNVANELIKSSGSAASAKPIFEAYATSLGLSKSDAQSLWNQVLKLNDSQVKSKTATDNLKNSFFNLANMYGVTKNNATGLWNEGLKLYAQIDSGKTKALNAKTAFEQFAAKMGVSKSNADQLWTSLSRLPKNVGIGVHVNASAGGNITFAQQVLGKNAKGFLQFHAKGGMVEGRGGATADDRLIMASSGEYVVKTSAVRKYGVHMMDAINRERFANGGLLGPVTVANNATSYTGTHEASFVRTADMDFMSASVAALRAAVHGAALAAAQAAAAASAAAGPGGGSASANYALAKRLYPMYAGTSVMDAWNYVAMRESGWNQFARNPSSGAYGIPQALPPTKMPFAAQAAGGSNPTAQIRWMWNYMAGSYGGPIGAAAHERAFNWYSGGGPVADRGTVLRPGWNARYNGTGRPEHLVPAGSAGGTHIYNFPHYIGSRNELVKALDDLRRQGRLPR
jgi:hypothetical protein